LPVPLAYSSQFQTWGETPSTLRERRLDIVARNISAVTVNVRRAKVGCHADVHIDTDGPIVVTLDPCGTTVEAGGS